MESKASVRYITLDVDASIEFYVRYLGFEVEMNYSPAFAAVVRGPLRILLSGPGSSGAKPMPDGQIPEPGGWNRIQIVFDDLEAEVARLKEEGLQFRNEVFKGVGGFQVILDDPSGNPIELWQNS